MKYQQDIIKRLFTKGSWPEFERRDFLSELDGIAEDAFLNGTLEGYLGALLIYTQLIEEMIKLLLRDIEFLTQLRTFPEEYHLKEYEKLTLGQIINVLENSIDFEGKETILLDFKEINQIRNDLVHNLTKNQDLDIITQKVEIIQDLYFTILGSFQDAHSNFWAEFEKISIDKTWLENRQKHITGKI